MTEDFYDLLEIPSDASHDEIKEAYREKVRVYHPDLNDDDRSQAQFTAVKKAYDILGDPVERQAYDRLGHENYVAKRTNGLPSPDVWKSDDSTSSDAGSTGRMGSASGSTATSRRSRSRTATSTASGTTANDAGTSTAGTTGEASTNGTPGATAGSATATNGETTTGSHGVGSTDGRTAHRTAGRTGSAIRTGAGRLADNALVRWWHRQNFAWPLIWLSVLTYFVGLGHYGRANVDALRLLWADLTAIGADPAALWEAVSTQRYGVQPPIEFVTGVELVAPPLPPTQWYGLLAGIVVAAFAFVCLARAVWRRDTWGPVTIDETIVVALAIGATTTLLGGPLLAGAALMPFLFGVIVYRTRQLPGWSPSYVYVLSVLAPLVGFALGAASIDSLPAEFAAFVFVPLVGALGLPLRATIKKWFDR